MANFFYRCKSIDGIKEGYIKASNISSAAQQLEKLGYSILELNEQKTKEEIKVSSFVEPLTLKEKYSFFNSFLKQYSAGISFYEIFSNMLNDIETNNLRSLCLNILKKLQNKEAFEDVFNFYVRQIGFSEVALIIAGEKSGKLEKVLTKIFEKIVIEDDFKTSFQSKLVYPKVIFSFLFISCLIFVFFVFPAFGATIAGKTVSIVQLIFFAIVKIAIVFALGLFFIGKIKENKDLKRKFLNWFLNLKIIKNIYRDFWFSNFFSIFSIAYEAGILPSEAIGLAINCVDEKYKTKILKAKNMIQEGCEITTALNITGIFENNIIAQIATGEKTGELPKVLESVSLEYKKGFSLKTEMFLKIIEPAMLVIAAILILILASIMISKYYKTLFSLF